MTRIIPHKVPVYPHGTYRDLKWGRHPEYTQADVSLVVDWLDGRDRPLALVPEHLDPWMVRWYRSRVGVKRLLE